MKKILGFMFILSFLISCQLSTSKTTITVNNIEENSKAKVIFNAEVKSGICIDCDE